MVFFLLTGAKKCGSRICVPSAYRQNGMKIISGYYIVLDEYINRPQLMEGRVYIYIQSPGVGKYCAKDERGKTMILRICDWKC